MTIETATVIVGILFALVLVGQLVLVLKVHRLDTDMLSREEAQEDLESVLACVIEQRQELQSIHVASEAKLTQAMTSLMDFVAHQQGSAAARLEGLDRDIRRTLAETAQNNEVFERNVQLLLKEELHLIIQTLNERLLSLTQSNVQTNQALSDKLEQKLSELRDTLTSSLEKIRSGNELKLEQMRSTVEEKLDKTLNERLQASFKTVDEKLGLVQNGLGEMRLMARSVSDLKGVLTNVKTRGTFGETQLEVILGDILTPDQYATQVRIIPGSTNTVDFAVRLPGSDKSQPCWLPIDAKFPKEDYERLVNAQIEHNAQKESNARAALERAILTQAKSIKEKYVRPPYTTEFGVMFLSSEGLYAEALRIPGLFDRLQRDWHITLAGPTVISALINSLQMGFVTLAMQERSAEVWTILGELKGEFEQFADQFKHVQKKFDEANSSLKKMGVRENVMRRKMKVIDRISLPALAQRDVCQEGDAVRDPELAAKEDE